MVFITNNEEHTANEHKKQCKKFLLLFKYEVPMSSSNIMTYKPLTTGGSTLLIFRFFMVIVSLSPVIFSLFAGDLLITNPSLFFVISNILTLSILLFGWIGELLLVIFLFQLFNRMENDVPQKRTQIKIAKIFSILIIIFLGLYLLINILVYMENYGIILLPMIVGEILAISMLVLYVLVGLFILIVFILFNEIMSGFDTLREFEILRKFSLAFGILYAFSYILLSVDVLIGIYTSNPTIFAIGTLTITLVSSFGGICNLIMSIGFILMGRRLQSS